VDRSIAGGMTLKRHWANKKAIEKIQSDKWDIIVIQEQSQMPVLYPKVMHQYARKLHSEIVKNHAKTRVIFFLTWARQHKPEMQKGLNDAYFGIAKELKAEVAPVGIAWESARRDDAELALHNRDKSHPTKTGTYLAACVFFAAIYHKSPEGLPGKIGGISDAQARKLQSVAWKTVQDLKSPSDGTP